MSKTPKLILRPARFKREPGVLTDTSFIFDTWKKSYCGAPAVRGMDRQSYSHHQHKVIEDLILRGATVLVACYEDLTDQIVSWVCLERYESALIVHYLYTKQGCREKGAAKEVMRLILEAEKPSAVFFTHKTKDIFKWEGKLNESKWAYHPFLAFAPPTTGEAYREEEKDAA